MSNIVIKKGGYQLAQPLQMVSMAKVLKKHIVDQGLFTPIPNKNYVHVEGWQFAGGLLGTYPRVVAIENLSNDKEVKWRAEVEIVDLRTGNIISRGFAVCSNKETKKKSFDEYAVLSMAQTRAIGKAYRNIIGWVMKLAGYETTPSEEMRRVDGTADEPRASETRAATGEKVIDIQTYECHGARKSGCGNELTKQEHDYSTKMYGKPLCRECQKEVKPLKK